MVVVSIVTMITVVAAVINVLPSRMRLVFMHVMVMAGQVLDSERQYHTEQQCCRQFQSIMLMK